MIDLHMHTLLSDGDLIPAELVQRAKSAGYKAMALTDHVDQSNLENIVPRIRQAALALTRGSGILVLAGVEITHVSPRQIPDLIAQARVLGAEIVVVHGETPVEPVPAGTNHAAIVGKADILAHPGLITLADAKLAKQNQVCLEITSRGGHSLTNGHVAKTALAAHCPMVIDSDTHTSGNLHSPALMKKVVLGAGLPLAQLALMQGNAEKICRRQRRDQSKAN
jgi:histidinol phosphatase-like PHP family hydrolase